MQCKLSGLALCQIRRLELIESHFQRCRTQDESCIYDQCVSLGADWLDACTFALLMLIERPLKHISSHRPTATTSVADLKRRLDQLESSMNKRQKDDRHEVAAAVSPVVSTTTTGSGTIGKMPQRSSPWEAQKSPEVAARPKGFPLASAGALEEMREQIDLEMSTTSARSGESTMLTPESGFRSQLMYQLLITKPRLARDRSPDVEGFITQPIPGSRRDQPSTHQPTGSSQTDYQLRGRAVRSICYRLYDRCRVSEEVV